LTRARFLGAIYPKEEATKRVSEFLARSSAPGCPPDLTRRGARESP